MTNPNPNHASQSGQNAAGSAHVYCVGEIAFAFDPSARDKLPSFREKREKNAELRWHASGKAEYVFIVEGPFRTANDMFYRALVMREKIPLVDELRDDEVYACRFNPYRIAMLWAEFPISGDQLIPMQKIPPGKCYVKKVMRARATYRQGVRRTASDPKGALEQVRLIKEVAWLTAVVDRRRCELES